MLSLPINSLHVGIASPRTVICPYPGETYKTKSSGMKNYKPLCSADLGTTTDTSNILLLSILNSHVFAVLLFRWLIWKSGSDHPL